MLVLSRKRDESVYIDGTDIRVVVVDIRGDKVRLGFDVPKEMLVLRSELYRGCEHGSDEGSEAGASGDNQERGGNRTA